MQQQEVLAKLQEVFDGVFLQKVVVSPELSADDVEEWDSLAHVPLILTVEQTFGIRFRVGEVEATKNVGDLVDLIIKRLPNG
jgi:acyl carrier protein